MCVAANPFSSDAYQSMYASSLQHQRPPMTFSAGGGSSGGRRGAAPLNAFVSQYRTVSPHAVKEYLQRKELKFRVCCEQHPLRLISMARLWRLQESGDELVVQDCPFCHPTKGQVSNQYKLHIKCVCCA